VALKNGFDLKLEATQILADVIIDINCLHCQQSCHRSAPTINAIVNINRRHPQQSRQASAPAVDAIVDINCQHHQKSRHVSAPAPLFYCHQQTIQISEVTRGNHLRPFPVVDCCDQEALVATYDISQRLATLSWSLIPAASAQYQNE
jgi:hypothetical protein